LVIFASRKREARSLPLVEAMKVRLETEQR
jgi:hypothetical protein